MSTFDTMTSEEIGQLFPIEVVPYDERWQQLFMAEAARVSDTLSDEVCAIEHIGSTAVPGLAAKPIIDSLLLVSKLDSRAKQQLIERLHPLGYENMANAETELTMEFGKGYDVDDPLRQKYHLHVEQAEAISSPKIIFRDRLRSSPVLREKYTKLKRELAQQYRHNREVYTAGKAAFVRKVISNSFPST
jgi:glutamate rich protein grpB family protein